jgi:uncharacterized protein (TIGR00255 family)
MAGRLASMTGYGRASGTQPGIGFFIEVKSVNGRGLDVRMRLASGFDRLDPEIRRRIGGAVARGSLSVALSVDREGEGGRVVVNRQALETMLAEIAWLDGRVEADRPRLDAILALPGVIEQHQSPLPPDEEEALDAAILKAVDQAVTALVAARREEGTRIAVVLDERIEEIEALTRAAEQHPGRSREAVLARLRLQVDDLRDAGAGVPEERLAQEAMLLATKVDVREELDRLGAHVAAARQLLEAGGAVGRRLDFL